ncbi:neuroglobin-like [Mizuhopecten yessoensis]|uniref:Neuroglobin n=1 Tax=Mizuhopecten yessoensis TaxID=6573 RepID=A0A210Q3Q0_MIZYE|nr:neuroglobin-like [Mizuhopecten yessoensis]OWF43371.1 Neuroglobin [Mizuhopecten yessoensis]
MGNQALNCPSAATGDTQLNTYLTPRQIHLVQDTWDIIKDDLSKLGVIVFLRLFETEPDLKHLFPKIVQMNEQNKLEWDIDRDMLTKHAVSVMEGLGAAVESLDESEFLNSVLISIGQTHVKRHVKPQMLKRLWPSLNYGLKQVLQSKYNKEVNEAWKKVYFYIVAHMKRGMENPDLDMEYDHR